MLAVPSGTLTGPRIFAVPGIGTLALAGSVPLARSLAVAGLTVLAGFAILVVVARLPGTVGVRRIVGTFGAVLPTRITGRVVRARAWRTMGPVLARPVARSLGASLRSALGITG
jgi:hypothetical protein